MCAQRFDRVIHVTAAQNGRCLVLDQALFPRDTTVRDVLAFFQSRRKGTYERWGFFVDRPAKRGSAATSVLNQFPLSPPTGTIPYDNITLWVWYAPAESEMMIGRPGMMLVG